jgi:hypothetical protein
MAEGFASDAEEIEFGEYIASRSDLEAPQDRDIHPERQKTIEEGITSYEDLVEVLE